MYTLAADIVSRAGNARRCDHKTVSGRCVDASYRKMSKSVRAIRLVSYRLGINAWGRYTRTRCARAISRVHSDDGRISGNPTRTHVVNESQFENPKATRRNGWRGEAHGHTRRRHAGYVHTHARTHAQTNADRRRPCLRAAKRHERQ